MAIIESTTTFADLRAPTTPLAQPTVGVGGVDARVVREGAPPPPTRPSTAAAVAAAVVVAVTAVGEAATVGGAVGAAVGAKSVGTEVKTGTAAGDDVVGVVAVGAINGVDLPSPSNDHYYCRRRCFPPKTPP